MIKHLNKIVAILKDGLISIYLYTSHGVTIPVFVVKEVNFVLLDSIRSLFRNQHFIMLTQDDIHEGKDVFCLKLLHIKMHSTLFMGTDIIWHQTFELSDLRSLLELEIRNKRVQLREAYLSHPEQKKFLWHLLSWMQLLWEWSLYLKSPRITPPEDSKELLALFDVAWSCNSQNFYYLIEGNIKDKDIPVFIDYVHQYLSDLCLKINAFSL